MNHDSHFSLAEKAVKPYNKYLFVHVRTGLESATLIVADPGISIKRWWDGSCVK
jgi:hypothetical protein